MRPSLLVTRLTPFPICLIFAIGIFGAILFLGGCDMSSSLTFSDSAKIKYIGEDFLVKKRNSSIYDIDIGIDGNIYIPDFRNNRVLVFDKDFNDVLSIENVPSPHGITVDDEGFIYVATYRSGRIYKFDSYGKEIKEWDRSLIEEKRISLPISLDIDANGDLLVADYDLQDVIRVDNEGRYIDSFDASVITDKGPFYPHSIVTDREKYAYVADRGKAKTIQVFTLDGKHVESWGQLGRDFDPLAVRFLNQGLLLIPNYKDSRLYLFDLFGRKIVVLGSHGDKPGQFLYITNLAAAGEEVYTVEEDGNRVQKINFKDIIKAYDKNDS